MDARGRKRNRAKKKKRLIKSKTIKEEVSKG